MTNPGPTAEIKTEYLFSIYEALEAPQVANQNLFIFNIPSGWVEGPRIKGEIVAPAADWGRVAANGAFQIDVRLSIRTDDDEIVFLSYTGTIAGSEASMGKLLSGQPAETSEFYWRISLRFETASAKYAWLNNTIAVGRIASFATGGEQPHVRYDVFAVA